MIAVEESGSRQRVPAPVKLAAILLISSSLGGLLWTPAGIPAEPQPEGLPAGTAALAFSAGFIRQTVPVDGVVIGTVDNRRLVGVGDLVYLQLAHPDEAVPGDLYTLYKRERKVFHPARGVYLGDLISIVGIVKVTQVNGDKAAVRVLRSYDEIFKGNGAMRYLVPRQEPVTPDRKLPDGPGIVVDLKSQRTLLGQSDVVYLDWGREQGLQIGDRVEIFRGGTGSLASPPPPGSAVPPRIVGEVQVVGVEDHTATGLIVRSIEPLVRGDRFTFKEPGREKETRAGPPEIGPGVPAGQ